jgi:hypothetical protein
MKAKKANEVATEKRRVVIINRSYVSPPKTCDRCTAPSGMITPDETAALCNVSTRTVYRWLETSAVHFSETAEGLVLICLSSLGEIGMNEGQGERNPERQSFESSS